VSAATHQAGWWQEFLASPADDSAALHDCSAGLARGWMWGPPSGDPREWEWVPSPLVTVDDGSLLCPQCGDCTLEGGEDSDVFVHPDRDDYEEHNPLKTRGGYTVIRIQCCCGAHLALVSANHKGLFRIKLFVVRVRKDPEAAPVRVFRSPIENAFWKSHLELGLPELRGLEPQYSISISGNRYYLDFALPGRKTGIELDGFATHSSTRAIASDRKRQRTLESAGWKIIRFGGKEVHDDAVACVREAARMISLMPGRPS
jgi:very-short-patch-repair endonuclease